MPRAPFCHIVIPAADLGKAKAFYEAVFEWEVTADNPAPTYWFFKSGNVGGAFSAAMKPIRDDIVSLYLRVNDLTATLQKIQAQGGMVIKEQGPIGEADPGQDAHFVDPNGNRIGLYSEA